MTKKMMSMKKMKKIIEDLAISDGIYDCICDPYDKFKTGDEYGSVMYDLERFAEKIINECCVWIDGSPTTESGQLLLTKSFIIVNIKAHFGVKQ